MKYECLKGWAGVRRHATLMMALAPLFLSACGSSTTSADLTRNTELPAPQAGSTTGVVVAPMAGVGAGATAVASTTPSVGASTTPAGTGSGAVTSPSAPGVGVVVTPDPGAGSGPASTPGSGPLTTPLPDMSTVVTPPPGTPLSPMPLVPGQPAQTPAAGSTPAATPAPGSSAIASLDPGLGVTAGNPFAGAGMYVNAGFTAAVNTSIAKLQSGSIEVQRANAVKSLPTGVWIDRIAAIKGSAAGANTMGVESHLRAAVQQQAASGGPMTALFVVYDLPDRDCAAFASNGELKSAKNGLEIYKTQYIDPLAALFAKPEFASLRIVLVIEPDSYPNLITNIKDKPVCAQVATSGVYVKGIQYAIGKFAAIKNVYQYIDIAHSAWLGWDSNRVPAVAGFKSLVAGATPSGSLSVIRGFVADTANYTPLKEPFFTATYENIRGDGNTKFYEWNAMIDETTYIDQLRNDFIAAGFPSTIGFLHDTGRSGWGGPARPKTASARVDDMRVDRRAHRGNWCNVKNAGIGERPRAAPDASRPHVDAYVWVKAPGESDGTSDTTATTPNADGKQFDIMCGATNVDALQGAPHAGEWFHNQFIMLLNNAYPPLQ